MSKAHWAIGATKPASTSTFCSPEPSVIQLVVPISPSKFSASLSIVSSIPTLALVKLKPDGAVNLTL